MDTGIPYVIHEITDEKAFQGLRCEWEEFLDRIGSANPFHTFEWLQSWWKALGADRELLVLAVRDLAGPLVALAPLMISRRFGLRVLEFIGTGLSDYPGFVMADGSGSALDAVFCHLIRHRRRWDVVELHVPEEAVNLLNIQLVARGHGLRTHQRVYTTAPFLEITRTWEDFVKAKSKKFRYALRERERRFTDHPGAVVRRLEACDIDGGLAGQLWEVEQHSWKVKIGTSPMIQPKVRKFYAEFLARFARRGWVQSWLAYLDGVPIAYVLNIVYGGRVFLYAISYHKDFHEMAPGMLLLQNSIREAFQMKASEYDFLCGDEPYKDRWATDKRKVLQIVLSQPNVVSFLGSLIAYRFRWRLARSAWLRMLKLRFVGARARLRLNGASLNES